MSTDKQTEKRWEILEVYNPKQGTGEPHKKQYGGDMSCDNMGCIIYSVKHLKDDQIYKVGDTLCHFSEYYTEKIKAIVKPDMPTDQMWFNPESNPKIVMSLSNFKVIDSAKKTAMSKGYSIRYNETITAVHNYIQLMDVLKDAAQGHIVEIRISDAMPESMQRAIISHNDVVKSKTKP